VKYNAEVILSKQNQPRGHNAITQLNSLCAQSPRGRKLKPRASKEVFIIYLISGKPRIGCYRHWLRCLEFVPWKKY